MGRECTTQGAERHTQMILVEYVKEREEILSMEGSVTLKLMWTGFVCFRIGKVALVN
jgi:hypothetical protein